MSKRQDSLTLTERYTPQPKELQHYGTVVHVPIALDASVRGISAENLNQLLVDKHFDEQSGLVDAIAERIQSLGGVSIAMAHDVAEMTLIPRPPRGREEVPTQIARLLHAHEIVLKEARAMARQAAEAGDDGTNDLLVSEV